MEREHENIEIEKDSQEEKKKSRREFLILSFKYFAASFLALAGGCKNRNESDDKSLEIEEVYEDLEADYDLSQTLDTPDKLLEFIEEESKWIEFGANFSWEHLDWLCQKEYGVEVPSVKEIFQYFEELGIKHVRVPFYIDQCFDPETNTISLRDKYLEILEEARETGVQLTISYGLKTPRWPEERITDEQLIRIYGNKENIPPEEAEISSDSPLGQFLQDYTRQILDILKNYSDVIEALQPENEPFNHFGQHRWVISPELLIKEIEIAREIFPDKHIYLNSPISQGHPTKLFREVIKKIPDLNLQVFWNNYIMFPWGDFFKREGENFGDDYAAAEMTDYRGDIEKINTFLSSIGVQTGISELQMEPWEELDPLKRFPTFPYNILRQIRALQLRNNPRNVRFDIWGIERLFIEKYKKGQLSNPKREVLQTIALLNHQE